MFKTIQYRLLRCAQLSSEDQSEWKRVQEPPPPFTVIDQRNKLVVYPGDLPAGMEALLAECGSQTIYLTQNNREIFEISIVSESEQKSLEAQFVDLCFLKRLGNDKLQSGDLLGAVQAYAQGIAQLEWYDRRTERDLEQVVIPLYLNKAFVHLKLCEWQEATECTNQVLEINPKNVKALYRRALARIEHCDYAMAKRDLLAAQVLERNNREVVAQLEQLYSKSVLKCRMDISINNVAVGWLKFRLFGERCVTIENFKLIVEAEKYDQCRFFRIVKDQYAQAGDYEYNDGSGGNCALEKCDREIRSRRFFNDESLETKHTRKGLLGMANYGPNTNQSQFYVTLGPLPSRDGKHVVFGELVQGESVLDLINNSEPDANVVIDKIQIVRY